MFAPAKTPPHLLTLILLTAVSVLALNMFLPSLDNIAMEFGTSYAVASLAVSGYLAMNAVLQLCVGSLADRYGRRPILLGCMVLFVVTSLICALSDNIVLFLAARMIQASVIAGSTLASAIISDTTDKAKAASRMGYVAMAMAVAPMVAPLVGGILDQSFGWRSGFWLYTGLSLGLLWLVWADVGETNPAPAATLWAQIGAYPELFRSRRFWGYALVMSFGVGAFFLFVTAAPFVGQRHFGLAPAAVGLGIGSITAGFFCGSFLSGRYATRMGINWMILAGRSIAAAGVALALVAVLLGLTQAWVFFAGAIFAGFGNGLSIPSARAGCLAVRPHLAGSASGLSGALVVAIGAVLTALPGLVLTPENAAWAVLAMMLALCLGALACGLWVLRIDRREGAIQQTSS